ncbi:MAG TPA: glycerophosphodiester phosphodiesterase [Acidimicrobiales bacterium]|nr:glycerophosphodiester phosphodiesterase [Acidimicrobiales bacterium]
MVNPWLTRSVVAYAHQGGAKEAPSSTLYAVGRAISHGATGVELDVHATSDGQLVVCHDPTLERTTDGSGPIARATLAEVEALDNAYFFVPGEDAQPGRDAASYPLRGRAPADRRFKVATLREVLEAHPGVLLNLDIKQTTPAVAPYEEALAALLREFGRADDVIVASFDDSATGAFKAFAPEIGTSPGISATTQFVQAVRSGGRPDVTISRHVALQVPPHFSGETLVDEALVVAAHEAGLAVHVWTVDDPDEMERLVDVGVDGIMSDVPSVLVHELDRLGVGWRP